MKKIFQFTLVLKKANETDHIEDKLYELGCGDALIHFRNGAVFLEFDRESSSLEEAVISAIKDIKSSGEFSVASIGPENLVTEAEIAKRLEINRQTVSLWIQGKRRKGFPHPIMRLMDKSPLWNFCEVCEWLYENKIIVDKQLIEQARFFENINAVLQEGDKKAKNARRKLFDKIFHQPRY